MSDSPLEKRPPPPIPLLILTGFLGAGKTTLLNRWVKTPEFADAAVVINEFGEIGIDHLLVERADGTMMTLSSGCICCTVRGDLVDTLEDLIRRRDNGRISAFNRVVIETTGLADPAPVLNAIMFHPYLPLRFRLDSVVTVVDAIGGLATLASHEEARKQVAVADTLVLSKSDLLSDGEENSELLGRLRALNPGARRLDAARGAASAAAVLGGGAFDLERRTAEVRHWISPEAFRAANHHHHHDHREGHDHHGHDHNLSHHDATVRATCLVSDEPLDPGAFQMFVDLLRSTHGARLLRIKGLVALRNDPAHPLVIQGVQHQMHPAHRLEGWPDADQRSRVVFITQDLPSSTVEKLWKGFFGPPAIDQPDAAGLTMSTAAGGLFG